MSETITKWMADGSPWLKYAIDTQLWDQKADITPVIKDKSIRIVVNRLKDEKVGIPALKTGKVAYTSTGNAFWDLYFLADIGLCVEDLKIEKEIEDFFNLQLLDSSFLIMDGSKPGYHCIPTIILASLVKMGYKDDPRIKKFINIILESQRLDGGWHCALSRAKGKKLQGTESCPMDNQNILMLLGQYKEFRTDPQLNGAIDLLLSHWQRRSEPWRPYGFGIGGDFIKLKYPAVKYGILRVLDVLSLYPYAVKSPEFQDMLNCVLGKSKDGKYFAESVARAYTEFDFGQTKEPSRWITFLIERIQYMADRKTKV